MLHAMKRLKLFAIAFQLLIVCALVLPGAARATDNSNAFENTLIDVLMRGQNATINSKTLSWSAAPSYYIALATTSGSDTACGTEVTGGSYARVAVVGSLANWAGTQSAGSTTASSGTGGTTSNNNAITFPTATASWGTVVEVCVYDASTAGNLLWRTALTTSKAVGTGDTPSFAAAALTYQIDN